MSKQSKQYESMRQTQTNTFSDGLNMDLHPLTTPNTILTDCVNGTMITYNDNEFVLQNDRGNSKINASALNEGFIPVGMKEHNGILYIVSHNPESNTTELGSFPSPINSDITKKYSNNIIIQSLFKKDAIIKDTKVDTELKFNDNVLVSGADTYNININEQSISPFLDLKFFAKSTNGIIENIKLNINSNNVKHFPLSYSAYIGYKFDLHSIDSIDVVSINKRSTQPLSVLGSIKITDKLLLSKLKNNILSLKVKMEYYFEGDKDNIISLEEVMKREDISDININNIVSTEISQENEYEAIFNTEHITFNGINYPNLDFINLYDKENKVLVVDNIRYNKFVIKYTPILCRTYIKAENEISETIELSLKTSTYSVDTETALAKHPWFSEFKYFRDESDSNYLNVVAKLELDNFMDSSTYDPESIVINDVSCTLYEITPDGRIINPNISIPSVQWSTNGLKNTNIAISGSKVKLETLGETLTPVFSKDIVLQGASSLEALKLASDEGKCPPGIEAGDFIYNKDQDGNSIIEGDSTYYFNSSGDTCFSLNVVDRCIDFSFKIKFELNKIYLLSIDFSLDDSDNSNVEVKPIEGKFVQKVELQAVENLNISLNNKFQNENIIIETLSNGIAKTNSSRASFIVVTTNEMLSNIGAKRMDELSMESWLNSDEFEDLTNNYETYNFSSKLNNINEMPDGDEIELLNDEELNKKVIDYLSRYKMINYEGTIPFYTKGKSYKNKINYTGKNSIFNYIDWKINTANITWGENNKIQSTINENFVIFEIKETAKLNVDEGKSLFNVPCNRKQEYLLKYFKLHSFNKFNNSWISDKKFSTQKYIFPGDKASGCWFGKINRDFVIPYYFKLKKSGELYREFEQLPIGSKVIAKYHDDNGVTKLQNGVKGYLNLNPDITNMIIYGNTKHVNLWNSDSPFGLLEPNFSNYDFCWRRDLMTVWEDFDDQIYTLYNPNKNSQNSKERIWATYLVFSDLESSSFIKNDPDGVFGFCLPYKYNDKNEKVLAYTINDKQEKYNTFSLINYKTDKNLRALEQIQNDLMAILTHGYIMTPIEETVITELYFNKMEYNGLPDNKINIDSTYTFIPKFKKSLESYVNDYNIQSLNNCYWTGTEQGLSYNFEISTEDCKLSNNQINFINKLYDLNGLSINSLFLDKEKLYVENTDTGVIGLDFNRALNIYWDLNSEEEYTTVVDPHDPQENYLSKSNVTALSMLMEDSEGDSRSRLKYDLVQNSIYSLVPHDLNFTEGFTSADTNGKEYYSAVYFKNNWIIPEPEDIKPLYTHFDLKFLSWYNNERVK